MTGLLAAVLCGGCTKFDLLNATIPPFGYSRTLNISYGPLPQQKLDVYRPNSAKAPADIVIFFYGGDWQQGSKDDYRFVAAALAGKGFIAVMPNYRLYPEVKFPAFVEDGALAVKWAHDHATEIGGDDHHLFLMGHSAGAHIAALLTLDAHYLRDVGLDRSAIAATAGLSGPYDFVPPPADRAALLMRDDEIKPPDETQPIHFVDGHAPPMLLVHGTADQTVFVSGTTHLSERITAAGGSVSTVLYPGKNHVDIVLSLAWPFRWIAPTLRDVTNYFHDIDHRIDQQQSISAGAKTPAARTAGVARF